ncbi:MAG: rRNA pseudouridine synthase [Desulfovibrio sp.]|nr:rRNA pseudouridine synthase [Desulfovibrio sp.]
MKNRKKPATASPDANGAPTPPQRSSRRAAHGRPTKTPQPTLISPDVAKSGLELPKENTHADGQRLNKAIAASGLCARRKADELIFAGRVSVDGTTETNPGRRVGPNEIISVDGKPLTRKQEFAYLLLNKPVGTVCTVSDPQGRPTVMDILPENARGLGLFPVGRLDFFSEGLLLLTNDGDLANRLTHPRHHVDKTYEVLVRGPVPEQALETMRTGMRLSDGTPLLPVAASRMEGGDVRGTLLRLVLRQGVNRQIRRMCEDLGLTILRLKRVAQGILCLDNLKPGETRVLKPEEVRALRKSAGLGEKPS